MNKLFPLASAAVFLGLIFLWTSGLALAQSGQGQQIFNDKCAMCHGQDGTGNGPVASAFTPSPANFTTASPLPKPKQTPGRR